MILSSKKLSIWVPQHLVADSFTPKFLKFLVTFPGDALEVGAIFLGELFSDREAVSVFGFVVFQEADVGDLVSGKALWAFVEDGGVKSACAQIGQSLVQVGVVDKT